MVEQDSRTVAQVLGEVTWLLSQSPAHRRLSVADLEWAVMPPLLLNQFHIFYQDKKPLAVAMWAYLSEDAEKALLAGIETKKPIKLSLKGWKSGDRLWLMEMICPTATAENKLAEQVMNDLAKNVLKDQPFKVIRINKKNNTAEMGNLDTQEMASA